MISRGLLFSLVWLVPVSIVWSCPFCDAPSITFSEQLKDAQAVAFVHWTSAEKPDALNFEPGSATYRVVTPFRQADPPIKVGELITIPFYQSGMPGDSFWILGSQVDGKFAWTPPTPMSAECWNYVVNAPSRDLPLPQRLSYYIKFLEHPDPAIAMDAYGEFAGAPYVDVLAVRKELSPERILSWLLDPEITPSRRGLYGLMLGLCGTAEDAKALEPILFEKPKYARLGIDGMMAGYILLTGETGFQKLTDAKLSNPEVIPGETFAILQTMRFLWEYAPQAVPRTALIQAMHRLLNHPQYASAAIIDLARWKDWDSAPLLAQKYGKGPYAERDIKEAIIRFLLVASAADTDSPAIQAARESLQKIRATEGALVRAVERRAFD